ncbi:MAG: hybrid sensor histidine kinase/response regulator [Gaiellaceae bacterium]
MRITWIDGRGIAAIVERRFIRKNGQLRFGLVSTSTVRADDDSILYHVGQVEDVTKLRQAHAELESSHELHRLVIESSRDVLSVFEPDGTIRLVSPSVTDILGYDARELVGLDLSQFVHPDDLATVLAAIDASLRGEETSVFRSRFRALDGTYHLWEGTVSRGLDRDGNPSFLVANSRDVTAQVELEGQLLQAQRMEAVGRLAGGVAHDFNNLLLAIRGYAELALEKSDAHAECSAEIAEVIDGADKAADLTRQLLAFSRRQMLNPQTFDLRDVIGDMVKLLRRLIGENVELNTVWPDEPTLVHADKAQLEQVVANLAVNARDAMPDGGHLSIEVSQDAGHRQVLLIVRDDGTGIDPVTAAQIFEPFFTTKGAEGTGLGLSTVHGVVTQSGGKIAVDSRLGEGTTFTISLPLAVADDPPPEPAAVPPTRGGSETILLAEDNVMVARAVSELLRPHGYRVISVESGEDAVNVARNAPGTIDLFLTDLVMRGLNGRQAAEAVLEHQPHTKVLYMSGYTDDVIIRVGRFEPGTTFIQKPFSGEELARSVRELLDTRTT